MESIDKSVKQKTVTLPRKEAHSLMTELEHKGFDYMCSELHIDNTLTVTYPASLKQGKQLWEGK